MKKSTKKKASAERSAAAMKIALCSWEIGRARSGFGAKVGGLGQVVEELPPELVKAGARQGIDLQVETLSPCFGHYDRSKLEKLDVAVSATIEGHTFPFEVYRRVFRERLTFPDGTARDVEFKSIYFWDEWQLHWTNGQVIYPYDPALALKLHSAISQAMAGYIRQGDFDAIHLHDYHVGLVAFFLGDDFLRRVPAHLTIHNATYQGVTHLWAGGYATLDRAGLPGERLFHKYFDFFDNVNMLKGAMLKVVEHGGRVTTVSGDLAGTWGYACELREGHAAVDARARRITGRAPGDVFVANRHLDVFEKVPVAGITNGLRGGNRPDTMPELSAAHLRGMLDKLRQRWGPGARLFSNGEVEAELLAKDHHFDASRLEVKYELKRLLYLEAFGHPIWGYPAIFGVVGRLVAQKNLGLVADVVDRVLAHDPMARFVILASAADNDGAGRALEARFGELAWRYAGRVWFNNAFNQPLSRLILAGSDFTLVPSRFEPCGLVDYEAALLGTIPICRATGGLAKSGGFGYLYEWEDLADPAGEAWAFFGKIKEALGVFRGDYPRHKALMAKAMAVDADWGPSAAQYVELYRCGPLARGWQALRGQDPAAAAAFAAGLGADRALFAKYFDPPRAEYGTPFEAELRRLLSGEEPLR